MTIMPSILRASGGARVATAAVALVLALTAAAGRLTAADEATPERATAGADMALAAPAEGKIAVAFLLSRGATVIDWAGPWEVFQDVMLPGRDAMPFELFTVAESREPIRASAGLQVVPDYTFEDAPQPRVIVVPAQGGVTPALLGWLRAAAAEADLTMSVCAGAFVLARAGLLDGREATTHHDFYDSLERRFPQVRVRRDVRWVEGPHVATAAGLTSGIDLALRAVDRYFGPEIAARTAAYMEHRGDGWRQQNGVTNAADTPVAITPTAPRAVLKGLDPVELTRGREVPGDPAIAEHHGGYLYSFANERTRDEFRSAPDRYAIQLGAACARMARQGAAPGSGDVDRFYVYAGRIYVFATEGCRSDFAADPELFLKGSGAPG